MTTEKIIKAFVIVLVIGILFIGRLFCAFGSQTKITDAIFVYQMECIRDGEPYEVVSEDAQSIDKTIWRFWDFGCKRILPREKYINVAPYIGVDYTLYAPDEYALSNEELWAAIAAAMVSE